MPRDVALFPSCTGEIVHPEEMAAGRQLLDAMGVHAELPGNRACCGWLALRAGWRGPAALLARRWILAYEPSGAVVGLSGDCVAMVHRHYPGLLKGHWRRRAAFMATRTFELRRFAERFGAPVDVSALQVVCAPGASPGSCQGSLRLESQPSERDAKSEPFGRADRADRAPERGGEPAGRARRRSTGGASAGAHRAKALSPAGMAWWAWAITCAVPGAYAWSMALVGLVARALPRSGRARWSAGPRGATGGGGNRGR